MCVAGYREGEEQHRLGRYAQLCVRCHKHTVIMFVRSFPLGGLTRLVLACSRETSTLDGDAVPEA